jgi:hypothetical protein
MPRRRDVATAGGVDFRSTGGMTNINLSFHANGMRGMYAVQFSHPAIRFPSIQQYWPDMIRWQDRRSGTCLRNRRDFRTHGSGRRQAGRVRDLSSPA